MFNMYISISSNTSKFNTFEIWPVYEIQFFVKDTGIDLMKEFDQTKLNNPVTDIVDSYYVAKAGYGS